MKSTRAASGGDQEADQDRLRNTDRYVAYYRRIETAGSTAEAALHAQRAAVGKFIKKNHVRAEFVEEIVGSRPKRPALESAVSSCRQHSATLIIADLGRLVRSALFTGLLRDAGVEFIALDASHVCRGNIGALAEAAARKQTRTSHRISVALAAARAQAKAEGRKFGNPDGGKTLRRNAVEALAKAIAARRTRAAGRARGLASEIEEIRAKGATSLSQVAIELNRRGVPAPRGGKWRSIQVQRTLTQLAW